MSVESDANNAEMLYDIHKEAARFYQRYLQSARANVAARQYLQDRNITEETIQTFGIGATTSQKDNLYRHLKKKGFSDVSMTLSGLVCKEHSGIFHDRFQSRIMLPICDVDGCVIGFAGRLYQKKHQATWLISPPSAIFKPGKGVFGLHIAKNYCEKKLVLVEGIGDVITMHQSGIKNVVSILRDEEAEESLAIIQPHTKHLFICYDADPLGFKKREAIVTHAKQFGLIAHTIQLPDCGDPTEYVQKYGANSLKMLLMTDREKVLKAIADRLNIIRKEDVQKGRTSTGFKELDKLTTGLVDGSLVVIAARPAVGKTFLALDIAKSLEDREEKTIVLFSIEMSAEQIAARMLVKSGYIDSDVMISGRISRDKVIQLSKSYLEKTRIQIYDNPLITVKDMQRICAGTDNLGAVIIDYFQLIDDLAYHTDSKNRISNAQSSIARELKVMAKNLGVPVICTSQLSKACNLRKDKRPMLSDLNCYGVLQQDADQIILLYRDSYYNPELDWRMPDGDVLECIVAKNRYGDLGTARIKWNQDRCAFYDIE